MARRETSTARRGDVPLRRRLALLAAILVALIAAHPGADATTPSAHSPSAAASLAHHSSDCPEDDPSHAAQACPSLSSSTSPVTTPITPSLTPLALRLPTPPAQRIAETDGTHLRPRLTQLAVSRT